MFKYLADLPKYAPNHRREDIVTIAVTDYYNLQKIDAKQAFYVIGADVYGPMGHEFIPPTHFSEEEVTGVRGPSPLPVLAAHPWGNPAEAP